MSQLQEQPQPHNFELSISTTTVTTRLKDTPINIIDIAKYLPLDDQVIGIKLVYAGSKSVILKGNTKLSKKKKDFLNQATISLNILDNLVSCKIFHNGTIHITGTHNLDEAKYIYECLYKKLINLSGLKMIKIVPNVEYLCSLDGLLYNTSGDIIGWKNGSSINLNNEYVVLDYLYTNCKSCKRYCNCTPDKDTTDTQDKIPVFMSVELKHNKKNIYSINGELVGHKELVFDDFKYLKKYYTIKYNHIYFKNQIIGKEKIFIYDDSLLQDQLECVKYFISNGLVLHKFDYQDINREKTDDSFNIHMINGYFKIPFKLCKSKLHKRLLDLGYYSRFDPCMSSSVNLRYHLDPKKEIHEQDGICTRENKAACRCKDVSVSLFSSGKVNITGIPKFEYSNFMYESVYKLITSNKEYIVL